MKLVNELKTVPSRTSGTASRTSGTASKSSGIETLVAEALEATILEATDKEIAKYCKELGIETPF